MENLPLALAVSSATWLTAKASPSAQISSSTKVVPASTIACIIAVLDVDLTNMVLPTALTDCQTNLVTPLTFAGWHVSMLKYNLVHKYPNILSTLQNGAIISMPHIEHTFTPSNSPSIAHHATQFHTIL